MPLLPISMILTTRITFTEILVVDLAEEVVEVREGEEGEVRGVEEGIRTRRIRRI